MTQGEISIDATAQSGPPPEDGWATFNVDRFLVEQVKRFHAIYRFVCAVETGTSKGHTTVGLAQIFPRVYTIEVDPKAYAETKPRFRCYPNVTAIVGNSSEVLKHILPELKYPLFVYLDAHWESYWPLRDELTILLAVKQPKLIMIHDFQVPGRSFGYDSYNSQPCNLNYIADLLPHDECRYSFNARTAPQSANRGVLFIEHLLPQ